MKPLPRALSRTSDHRPSQPMVGESLPMQELKAYVKAVAATDSPVLITGETGTGKELVAAQIHQQSRRSQQPLVCLNCAAIPDSLLESELFGYERGAFTGAIALTRGAFEQADEGTLFLDEIGDMSLFAQAKILRTIEDQAIHRLGSQQSTPLNIRIIAATNQDLEGLIAAGRFRNDLYFRLNVASIHLPPLRDRKADLWLLCQHYTQVLNQRWGRAVEGFAADVFEALLRYTWPGNVRELKNLLEAIFITLASQTITFTDLPTAFRKRLRETEGLPLTERDRLLTVLTSTHWNKSQAAQQLHWSRMTLYRKLRQYQLTVPRAYPPQRPSAYGRGQKGGTVSPNVSTPGETARGTGGPPNLPLSEMPDALWQRMAAVIALPRSPVGHPRTADLRRITEGIFFVLRTGIPWHDCPRERFGPPSTVYYYFVQWVNKGVFDQLWMEALTRSEEHTSE